MTTPLLPWTDPTTLGGGEGEAMASTVGGIAEMARLLAGLFGATTEGVSPVDEPGADATGGIPFGDLCEHVVDATARVARATKAQHLGPLVVHVRRVGSLSGEADDAARFDLSAIPLALVDTGAGGSEVACAAPLASLADDVPDATVAALRLLPTRIFRRDSPASPWRRVLVADETVRRQMETSGRLASSAFPIASLAAAAPVGEDAATGGAEGRVLSVFPAGGEVAAGIVLDVASLWAITGRPGAGDAPFGAGLAPPPLVAGLVAIEAAVVAARTVAMKEQGYVGQTALLAALSAMMQAPLARTHRTGREEHYAAQGRIEDREVAFE